MSNRFTASVAIAMCWVALSGTGASAETRVLITRSSAKAIVSGQPHLVLVATSPRGQRVRLVVPNNDPKAGFNPLPDQLQLIQSLKPNDLVEAAWNTADGINVLDSISRYAPKPGETSANGYVFRSSQLKPDSDDIEVRLDKLGESTTAILPGTKGKDGAVSHDALVTAVLAGLTDGDPIWADLGSGASPRLIALLPWSEPQKGKITRLVMPDSAGHRNAVVEIATANARITAGIPSKSDEDMTPNARLLAVAKAAGPGDTVLFRTQTDDATLWLRDLQLEPKTSVATDSHPQHAPGHSSAGSANSGDGGNSRPNDPPGLSGARRALPGGSSVPGVGSIPGGF